jgi:nucleotide-binding universal stress UspA family protein
MRRILVAIDGSDSALRALHYAQHQAALVPGTELHLLTALEPVRVYGEIEVYVDEARMREVAAQQARAGLEVALGRLRDSGITVSSEVLEGDPAELIAKRAGQLDCESIVTGTRGLGRIGTLLMGSVAQHVVRLADRPVTLVK